MALILQLELPNGATVSYWKILDCNVNMHDRRAHVTLGGFVNEQARLAGRLPLTTESCDWTPDDFPFTVGANWLAQAYLSIKEREPFTDAIDA